MPAVRAAAAAGVAASAAASATVFVFFLLVVIVIHAQPSPEICSAFGLSDHAIFSVHQQRVGAQLGDPFVDRKVHIVVAKRVGEGHGYLAQANHDENGEEEDNGSEEGDERQQ